MLACNINLYIETCTQQPELKIERKKTKHTKLSNYSIDASDENGITEIVNWACKTNLTSPLFIKVQIPSQDLGF
jgi:uncharacterized protein YxeA